MMSKINIKIMSDTAYEHIRKNLQTITDKIINNEDNKWIQEEFEDPIFIEKKYEIQDFELKYNPESKDKEIYFENSITIYNSLNILPKYILSDDKFWLWLHFEKFYSITRSMMKINGPSTIRDHWLGGNRRGLFFGVLSRCYFRVSLSLQNSGENKYELTRWVIENPERFRNLTWRSFSSQRHLVRGILRGEKRAVEEMGKEDNSIYEKIGRYVSTIGSVRLLDVISEEDMEEMIYQKCKELLK